MLEEQKREEKSGYRAEILAQPEKNTNKAALGGYQREKSNRSDDIIETYGDDFEEEIEEDLPEDNHLLDSNENVNAQKGGVTESMGGITVSQSLGVDPSVDSLALEDYDHIEPVERIG
jgi:hypothetical protein